MKVLILNGSPRKDGNTCVAISEITKIFDEEKIEYEHIQVGNEIVRGCLACQACSKLGKCVQNDIVNVIAEKFEKADALIVASPVYYASANATLVALLQRLFYSTSFNKSMKVGASIAIARRGGCESTFDELNKFFAISSMPIVTSQYWDSVYGRKPGEAVKDEEGLQTMRLLAKNLIFLMRSIELGKEKYGVPEKEKWISTSFIK